MKVGELRLVKQLELNYDRIFLNFKINGHYLFFSRWVGKCEFGKSDHRLKSRAPFTVSSYLTRVLGLNWSTALFFLMSKLYNFFSSSLTTRSNKLVGLPLETLSSWVLEFEGKARATPIKGPLRCFLLG